MVVWEIIPSANSNSPTLRVRQLASLPNADSWNGCLRSTKYTKYWS